MVEVMKIMVTSFKRSRAVQYSVPLTLQQATVDPHLHQRLLDTHVQVWVSLLGNCSFLLGPGVNKVLFVPSKSLFPQSCVSSGNSVVGLMVTSSKRAYATPRLPHPEALPLRQATAELYLRRRHSSTVLAISVGSLGPGAHKVGLSPLSISSG